MATIVTYIVFISKMRCIIFTHAPTPWETTGLRELLSQSHSTWERPGPDQRPGGRLSGETEALTLFNPESNYFISGQFSE